jgi:hypothetical protein
MVKMQISVPEELHGKLVKRCAQIGITLPEYVKALLIQELSR